MAIDGVGILESDLAQDIYNLIMDLYHSGESIQNIKEIVEQINMTDNELDEEIFSTVYALAMWDIGGLSIDQLQDLRIVVLKGASDMWNGIGQLAKAERQRVLHELLVQLEEKNTNIKKRKKYKTIKNTYFKKGDILMISMERHYRCMIFNEFYQYREDAYYSFIVTTYNSQVEPTIEKLLLEEIPVMKKTSQGEYGLRTLHIDYQFIDQFKSQFNQLGVLQIDPESEKLGFTRQICGLKHMQELEKEMDDILLGEKVELFHCCLFEMMIGSQ